MLCQAFKLNSAYKISIYFSYILCKLVFFSQGIDVNMLNFVFQVTRESGPPHMKTFVTRCTVGDFVTEAEGNSKQVSKKRAAESMLEELKKLQPLPPTAARPKAKSTTSKKKNRNLIKVCYQDQLQQVFKNSDYVNVVLPFVFAQHASFFLLLLSAKLRAIIEVPPTERGFIVCKFERKRE